YPGPSRMESGQPGSSWPWGEQRPGWHQPFGSPAGDVWSTPGGRVSPPTTPIWPPPPSAPERGRGPIVGAMVVSLIVGLVAGGAGGVLGYHVASSGIGAISALDQRVPAALPGVGRSSGSVEQVAARVTPSVAELRVNGSQVSAEGSGIVL